MLPFKEMLADQDRAVGRGRSFLTPVLGISALAISATIFSGAAAAAEPNAWYVGGAVGQSSFRSDLSAQINRAYDGSGFTVEKASVTDNADTGWKVYGGWQFHRNAAVELGYLDFGRATTHYEVVVPAQGTAIRDGKYRMSGVELSLVAIAPIGERASVSSASKISLCALNHSRLLLALRSRKN